MKKVLCYDSNRNFTSDVEMQLLLNDFNINIITRNSLDKLKEDIERVRPDEVVLSVSMLNSRPNWDLGLPVFSFARNAGEVAESEEKQHIPCYGIVNKAETLIELIIAGKTMLQQPVPQKVSEISSPAPQTNVNQTAPHTAETSPYPQSSQQNHDQSVYQKPVNENVPQPSVNETHMNSVPENSRYNGMNSPAPNRNAVNSTDYAESDNRYNAGQMPPYYTPNPMGANSPVPHMESQTPGIDQSYRQPQNAYPQANYPYNGYAQPPYYQDHPQQGQQPPYYPPYPGFNAYIPQNEMYIPKNEMYGANNFYPNSGMNNQNRQSPVDMRHMPNNAAYPGYGQGMGLNGAAYEVEKDMGNIKKSAKLVAVYSAKGGVGKTTVTCNLATYLSLTEHHGRDRYKVCIVDFNIDFGDVATTLGLDPNRGCMTQWANNIKQRLKGITPDQGEKYSQEQLDSVAYTESQIKDFLQRVDETGLYVLLAPISNEDSMFLTENEIEIMLNNLINYGGFDFIICDTGNNTRDSSFIPLTKADEVYVIMNQSATTANCNAGFLNTMYKIGYDLNKIHILINMAMSYKSTGISIDEIREAFINPYTKKPYDIVGILKDYDDVRNHNNMQQPLVYNSKHEYTKCIGEIANKLIGDNSILKSTDKPKFKLFGKRKK